MILKLGIELNIHKFRNFRLCQTSVEKSEQEVLLMPGDGATNPCSAKHAMLWVHLALWIDMQPAEDPIRSQFPAKGYNYLDVKVG
jgi:hypothetical protein